MSADGETFRPCCPPRYESSGKREADFYPTPGWCVGALLQHAPPPERYEVVEPSAGEGHIVRAYHALTGRRVRLAVELREECREALVHSPTDVIWIEDWLRCADRATEPDTAIIGNPPFTLAIEFARACVESRAGYVALLLPLTFLASAERHRFHREHPVAQLVVLSKRPSFTGDSKTDCAEYSWFVWGDVPRGISWALPGEA